MTAEPAHAHYAPPEAPSSHTLLRAAGHDAASPWQALPTTEAAHLESQEPWGQSGAAQGGTARVAAAQGGAAAPGGVPLRREQAVPGGPHGCRQNLSVPEGQEPADGVTPEPLATRRQERRQIIAISRIVIQAAAEALSGVRPVHQMQRWLDPEVYRKIQMRAELAARQRAAFVSRRVRPAPLQFRRVTAQSPQTGSWETAVVFRDEQRTRACAMRLEAHRGRWRVVAMELG